MTCCVTKSWQACASTITSNSRPTSSTERYYRFAGKVERGSGRQSDDADYVHLVGNVEIVTQNGDSGQESVAKKHLVLKCMGKSESEDE